MCHQTKFNLAIVGTEEHLSFIRNESLAQFASQLISDRNILQIRVARRKSSRSSDCLVELCVNTTCTAIDVLRQSFDVGREQFFYTSVVENLIDDWRLVAEFLQHLFACRILTALCFLRLGVELHFIKENHAYGFRGKRIEWMTCNLSDTRFDVLQFLI